VLAAMVKKIRDYGVDGLDKMLANGRMLRI
jgi:hypothetical protein